MSAIYAYQYFNHLTLLSRLGLAYILHHVTKIFLLNTSLIQIGKAAEIFQQLCHKQYSTPDKVLYVHLAIPWVTL